MMNHQSKAVVNLNHSTKTFRWFQELNYTSTYVPWQQYNEAYIKGCPSLLMSPMLKTLNILYPLDRNPKLKFEFKALSCKEFQCQQLLSVSLQKVDSEICKLITPPRTNTSQFLAVLCNSIPSICISAFKSTQNPLVDECMTNGAVSSTDNLQ